MTVCIMAVRRNMTLSTSEWKILSMGKDWNREDTSRNCRILTLVYNTQKYWVPGLCPSSGILNTRKHNVSENGYLSILR
jgi:hypothetical protein